MSWQKDRIVINSRRTAFQQFFKLEEIWLRFLKFNGAWSSEQRREVFHIGKTVCVLLYDPDQDKVLLVEQLRIGVADQCDNPWLLECVAGLVDDGEDTQLAAIREVEEETGLKVSIVSKIGTYTASPGAVNEVTDMYAAKINAQDAGGTFGLHHEGEDIKTHIFGTNEVFEMLDRGAIIAANSVIPLRWLQVHKTMLDEQWKNIR